MSLAASLRRAAAAAATAAIEMEPVTRVAIAPMQRYWKTTSSAEQTRDMPGQRGGESYEFCVYLPRMGGLPTKPPREERCSWQGRKVVLCFSTREYRKLARELPDLPELPPKLLKNEEEAIAERYLALDVRAGDQRGRGSPGGFGGGVVRRRAATRGFSRGVAPLGPRVAVALDPVRVERRRVHRRVP